MRLNKHIMVALVLLVVAGACKKDKNTSSADLFYEVQINGYSVTFKNETTGAASYKWDFGDGDSSTEESPVHTYPGKGKYVPTLYAYTKEGKVTEGSTVVNIAKTSPVKLDDNSLADWDTISMFVVTPAASETYFKKAKFDYDANYIYCYFEVKSTKAANDIFDIYLDSDNNPAVGYATGTFLDAGMDVLIEGTLLDPTTVAPAMYNYAGTNNSWAWNDSGASEFYTIGTTVQDGTTLKYEMRFVRNKIKNLPASTGFRIGIQASKNDWSVTYGSLPGSGVPAYQVTFE